MPRCPDAGRWRAYLDEELALAERHALVNHLEACGDCRAALATIRQTAEFARQHLQALAPTDEALLTRLAWQRLHPQLAERPVPITWRERIATMLDGFQRPGRLALSGALASLSIVLMLALTPAASYALQAISIFRVQTFKAITFEVQRDQMPGRHDRVAKAGERPADLQQARQELERELAKVGITLTSNVDEQTVREVADVAAARSAGQGASVKQVTELPAAVQGSEPEVMVAEPTTSTFEVDLAALRQALKDRGEEVPEALPGISPTATEITATLKTSFSVVQAYGEGEQALVFAQGASPELTFSEGIDVLAIRDAVLAMPGIPKTMRTQILSIRDDEWGRTLFIPVPTGTIVQDVTVGGALGTPVGGVPGLLLFDPQAETGAVLWQKDGTLYAIGGPYDQATLLRAANSVR